MATLHLVDITYDIKIMINQAILNLILRIYYINYKYRVFCVKQMPKNCLITSVEGSQKLNSFPCFLKIWIELELLYLSFLTFQLFCSRAHFDTDSKQQKALFCGNVTDKNLSSFSEEILNYTF